MPGLKEKGGAPRRTKTLLHHRPHRHHVTYPFPSSVTSYPPVTVHSRVDKSHGSRDPTQRRPGYPPDPVNSAVHTADPLRVCVISSVSLVLGASDAKKEPLNVGIGTTIVPVFVVHLCATSSGRSPKGLPVRRVPTPRHDPPLGDPNHKHSLASHAVSGLLVQSFVKGSTPRVWTDTRCSSYFSQGCKRSLFR